MPRNIEEGVTLIESLISILLIGTLLAGILGAFYISKLSTSRARHRIAAMNKIRELMEKEIQAGFLGGVVDATYYMSVSSQTPAQFVLDDRFTDDDSDDLMATIRPSPYPAAITTIGSNRFKTVGFAAEWTETTPATSMVLQCSEKAITYVAERS